MPKPARPDPAQGVFETLLVLDGEPVELGAHLERLAGSLRTLYNGALPRDIEELANEAATGLNPGRLRLTVVPDGGTLHHRATAEALDPAVPLSDFRDGTALESFLLPGGLGAYKWCDRSRLPARDAGTTPLLLDRSGEVLEASWANVFAVHEGVLSTPPLDGRILPGVTRAAALDAALNAGVEVVERRLERRDLLAADEVFLTSSLRRVEAAHGLDGAALSGVGEVGEAIAASLRSSRVCVYPRYAGAGADSR